MWTSTPSVLKRLLSTVLSILVVPISGLASKLIWLTLKGRNYSDVGVPMYENSSIATFAAFLVFFIVLFGLLYLLQRTISRNAPYLM
jgi:Zn-dependent protease with chaperone function